MTPHDRYEDLVAGHALDALLPDERHEIEEHLRSCETCRQNLADLRRVSAGLGLAVDPIEPPPSLRDRTIARAIAQGGKAAPSTSRPSWFALAASLVAAAGLGLYALSLQSQLQSTREMLAEASSRNDTLRRDLASVRADAARLTSAVSVLRSVEFLRVSLGGRGSAQSASGRAFITPTRGLVFAAERLPTLPANRAYQLWVIPPGEGAAPVSAAVFSVDGAGNSLLPLELPDGVSTVAVVAVTVEPAGGSVGPTTDPILVGTVAAN